MKPTDAWPTRVFMWTSPHTFISVGCVTLYVVLKPWSPQPKARLKTLILDTTYPHHAPGSIMWLEPNDPMWKNAKRIA